jgi:hypothetical protein
MAAFEVLKHLGQLARSRASLEIENPADNVVGPGSVRGIKVSRLGGRLEGSDDDPGRIRTQM